MKRKLNKLSNAVLLEELVRSIIRHSKTYDYKDFLYRNRLQKECMLRMMYGISDYKQYGTEFNKKKTIKKN